MAMLEESLRLRVIGRGARNFRAYAELARDYEPRRWSSNGTANTVLRMPAGPTVVITPWNAPVHALDVEVRPGARRRQHRGLEAGRVVAARAVRC